MLIITGSLPPDICGVGDYTRVLADGLKNRLASVNVFYKDKWPCRMLIKYAAEIRKCNAEIINIQYPTRGYGKSVAPHLLGLLTGSAKKVVTLHEFSRASMKGKAAMYLFFLVADWIIFTTEYERTRACRIAPWIRAKSSTVHIASNIPMRDTSIRDTDIVYFGHICRSKGLEEFASIIDHLGRDNLKIQVIGQIMPGEEAYVAGMLERFESLGAEIILGRSASEVSCLLSQARIAVLPFPDGMSLRRGSALAAMGNGALLLTTFSSTDAAVLEGKCLMARNTVDLRVLLNRVLDDYYSYDSIRIAGRELARSFSWDRVLAAYVNVIEAI